MNRYANVLPSSSTAYTVYNIQEEDLPIVEKNMRPGGYSSDGFIAAGESLLAVCEKDFATLLKLGISCDLISDALDDLVEKAKQATAGSFANVATIGKFKVSGFRIATNGHQECPFGSLNNPCHIGRGEITIENTELRKLISFSPLLIPMIRFHGCFEGAVPSRLDPESTCQVLELTPDVGTKKRKVEEKTWKACGFFVITEEYESIAKQHAREIRVIDQFATAYLGLPCIDLDDLIPDDKEGTSFVADENPYKDLDDDIKFFFQKDTNQQTTASKQGKEYCHLFNKTARAEDFRPKINGISLNVAIVDDSISVFELDS